MQIAMQRSLKLTWAWLTLAGATIALWKVSAGFWFVLLFAIAYAAVLYRRPGLWLLLLPALVPVVDLTKLSGHIFVTESDILILITVGIGNLKAALASAHAPASSISKRKNKRAWGFTLLLSLLLISYLLSTLLSLWPLDAMRMQLAGFHGYGNSLRVVKGFVFAVLLIPLLQLELQADSGKAVRLFSYGLCLGLAAVSAFAINERLAFTSLTDFASDYRITASFWEMNVGGAAVDGFLTLTFPFAVWLALTAHRADGTYGADADQSTSSRTTQVLILTRMLTGPLLLLTASYVLLVTFTRTTYAATGLMGLIILGGLFSQHQYQSRDPLHKRATLMKSMVAMLAAIGLVVAMHLVFQSGGYRTLAALIIVVMASHFVAPIRLPLGRDKLTALGLGLVFCVASVAADRLTSKGSYLAFAGLTAGLIVIGWQGHRGQKFQSVMAGLWGGLVITGALIARHWGGSTALVSYAMVASMLVLIVAVQWFRVRASWRWSTTSSSGLLIVNVMIGLAVAIIGNYQMTQRFSEASQNWTERKQHWGNSINLLKTPQDWLVGRGIGSYPYRYLWEAPERLVPGTMAFMNRDGEHFVRLTSSHTNMGFAEMLRLMQRVAPADVGSGSPIVRLRARAQQDVKLAFEVCARHLIYVDDCVSREIYLTPKDGQWQDLSFTLNYGRLNPGPWYARKSYAFALAIGSTAKSVEVASVELLGTGTASNGNNGGNLLQNADFRDGTDHWFFTSDRNHLPYHVKNIFLHLLFEQGLLGLSAFLMMVVAALARTWKYRRSWNDAPYFIASIVGFLFTGLFDSLLDVPRVAVLFYLLCWMLLLRPQPSLNLSTPSKT